MSETELMVAIRKLADELGRTPGREELTKRGISRKMVRKHFAGHREAMKACRLVSDHFKSGQPGRAIQDLIL